MKESSLILYDNFFIDASIGTPCSVEFNFEKAWEFKKSIKDFDPKLLKFYHVHPEGFLDYSDIDLNCIKGLNIAMGCPVYFSIITFLNNDLNEHYYHQISYKYLDKQMEKVEDIPLMFNYSFLLKYLSYFGG